MPIGFRACGYYSHNYERYHDMYPLYQLMYESVELTPEDNLLLVEFTHQLDLIKLANEVLLKVALLNTTIIHLIFEAALGIVALDCLSDVVKLILWTLLSVLFLIIIILWYTASCSTHIKLGLRVKMWNKIESASKKETGGPKSFRSIFGFHGFPSLIFGTPSPSIIFVPCIRHVIFIHIVRIVFRLIWITCWIIRKKRRFQRCCLDFWIVFIIFHVLYRKIKTNNWCSLHLRTIYRRSSGRPVVKSPI